MSKVSLPALSGRIKHGRLLAMFLLGAVLALGQPPFGFIWVAYPALVAAFYLLNTSNRLFAHGWAFGTGYFATSLSWIVSPFLVEPWRHGWMAPFAVLLLALGLALFWALAARACKGRANRPLMLALGFSIAELTRGFIFTGFPWGLIGTIWLDTPVMQLAAWVGTYGVTFLTVLSAGIAAKGISGKAPIRAVLMVVLPIVVVFGFGIMREGQKIEAAQPLVRLVQPNAPQHLKFQREFALQNFEDALALTGLPSEQKPDIVIWPETALPFWLDRAELALVEVSQKAGGATVLLGANRRDEDYVYNSLLVVREGQVQQIYDKGRLVPFGEYLPLTAFFDAISIGAIAGFDNYGYRQGQGNSLLDLGDAGIVKPAICYEAVFPQGMRKSDTRPNWIVHITNDAWFGKFTGPQQHLAQARLRSIELGLPMARAANTGISAVIDAKGEVVNSIPLNTQGMSDVAMPMPYVATFYAKWGEIPLLIGLFLLGLALIGLNRRNSH